MQKSSLSTPYVQRKRVFLGGGMLDRPCLGHLMDLAYDAPAILRCAEAMHVHQIQSVSKFEKKAVPQLIDPGENILPFPCDFCDTSRTTEATSTRKTL